MPSRPRLSVFRMHRIEPFLPIVQGLRRVEDRRVVMQWKNAPPRLWLARDALRSLRALEPSRAVFDRIVTALIAAAGVPAPQGVPDGRQPRQKGAAACCMLHAASGAPGPA